MDFNYRAFHRRRKIQKWIGAIFLTLGFFTIIDMISTVPIPITGIRAVFVGTLLMIFGLIWLYKGYRLPLEEAIELIHGRSQGITESEIVHEMMVDKITAHRILNALVQKGFIRPSSSQAGQAEEVYDAVK